MLKFNSIFVLLLTSFVMVFASSKPSYSDWIEQSKLLETAEIVPGSIAQSLDLEGPLILTFFASWCPPCTDEFNNLNRIWDKLGGNPSHRLRGIVAINLHENFGGQVNQARMNRFIKKTKPRFPLLKGTPEISAAFGGIDRIPTVIAIDRKGNEFWRFVHITNAVKTHATEQELLDVISRMETLED